MKPRTALSKKMSTWNLTMINNRSMTSILQDLNFKFKGKMEITRVQLTHS